MPPRCTTWRVIAAIWIASLLVLCVASHVLAGDLWRAQHVNDPNASCDNVCQWVRDLKMPDNPGVSCCGEGDRFEADLFEQEGSDFFAVITDGKDIIPDGTRVLVPQHKFKWDNGNPTGHGQIFLGSPAFGSLATVYCFVPGGGV